jgi:hypothetical protein
LQLIGTRLRQVQKRLSVRAQKRAREARALPRSVAACRG